MLRSVLVADSDVEARDRFYEILFSLGYKVECVPNASEIINRLETERPYLIIVDEDLAAEGGLKALEKIREFDRQAKVVFLTKDEPGPKIRAEVLHLDVSSMIKKDFSTHFMFKKILEILKEAKESIKEDEYLDLGKILVVDDSQEMRLMLTAFLRKIGFMVKDAVDGEQALMEIKMEKPKLVLLDERMPGMDGLVVLKKIREIDSSLKVVMLTAVQDEDVIKEADKLGALDYVTKPFDLEKLEALILSILVPEKHKYAAETDI